VSGYTPVFDTVFNGTLCGKWPDLPVWLSILPLSDWQGHIDMTPQAIAKVTGWPIDLLLQGIQGLMEPDADSRSQDEEGRRLVPLDPARKWGWRVVNIQKYRRLASGQNHSANQVADGRNAEKVRRYKERHHRTPRTPSDTADTSEHQNSYSDINTDSDSEKNLQEKTPVGKNARKRATSVSTEFPLDFALDDALRAQALKRAPDCDVEASFAQFQSHHESRGAKFKNWRQAWTTWVSNYEQFGYPKRRAVNGKSLAEIYPGVKW